jgi:hypothetical protein
MSEQHWLFFENLHEGGHGYKFPCDAKGKVDVEQLSRPMQEKYYECLQDRDTYTTGRVVLGKVMRPKGYPPRDKRHGGWK